MSSELMKFRWRIGLLIATMMVAIAASSRASITWNVAGSGNWDTGTANWTGDSTTFTDDGTVDVVFTNTAGGTITISANMSPLSTTVSAASGTYTFTGGPIDSGSLTKSGAGKLVLSSTNTYSGGTTLNAGELDIGNNSALGTGTLTINGGSIYDTKAITLAGNIPIVLNASFSHPDTSRDINLGGGPVTLSNSNVRITTAHGVIFGGTISGPGNLNGFDLLLGVNSNDERVTLTSGVTLRATQTVTLDQGGTLTVNGVVGDGGYGYGFTVAGGNGGVVLGNASHTFGGPVTVNSGNSLTLQGSVTNSYIVVNSGGTLTLGDLNLGTTGTIAPGTAITNNGTMQVGQNRTVVQGTHFPGAISGTGLFFVTGQHGGVTLNGVNTYSGGTTVGNGSNGVYLNINHAQALGAGPLTINNAGTIDNASAGAITVSSNNAQNWNGNFTFTGTQDLNMGTGAVTMSASRTVTVSARTLTVGGSISGSGYGLTKAGNGALTLAGANSYSGGTALTAGTLNLANAAAIATGTFTISGGAIDNTSGSSMTLAGNNVQGWNGSFTFVGSNPLNLGSGSITLGATPTVTVAASTLTVGGVISGSYGLTKAGAGSLTLTAANTFTGTNTISGGRVILGNTNALQFCTYDTTGSNGGTTGLDVSGFTTLSLGALSGATNLASALIGYEAVTNLILNTQNAGNTYAGIITNLNSAAAMTVTKTGWGMQTLSGAGTYTGATTVNSGLLRINGSLAAASAVTVTGGSIGGTGTISGSVTLSGTGGIDLRNSLTNNALTIGGDLEINGDAGANSLFFDLGTGAGADKLVVNGAVTMNTPNAAVIQLNQLTGGRITAGTYDLITSSSTTNLPAASSFTLLTTRAFGDTFNLALDGSSKSLQLITTQSASGPASAFWSGALDSNWSTTNNWNTNAGSGVVVPDAPGYQSDVSFYTTNPVAANLNVTLDTDSDIRSLSFTTNATSPVTISGMTRMLTIENAAGITANTPASGTVTHTINARIGLAASQTWTVNSNNAANYAVLTVGGNVTDFGGNRTMTKVGGGTLNLNGATTVGNLTIASGGAGGTVVVGSGGTLSVGSGPANTLYVASAINNNISGTLDASASAGVVANVGTLSVGSSNNGSATPGYLYLGTNNVITATSSIRIGADNNSSGSGTVTTAPNGITAINTAFMKVGALKADTGTFTLGAGSTLTLAGISSAPAQLVVGIHDGDAAINNNRTSTGLVDLSGGTASLTLGQLTIGSETMSGNQSNKGAGQLILSTNSMNRIVISGPGNVVLIGYQTQSSSTAVTTGTLTIGNVGTNSTITSTDNSTAILIGCKAGGNINAAGTLTIQGGTLTVATTGSAIAGGGGTSALNLRDCTLIAGASSTNWISGLTAATLTNRVIVDTGANSIVVPQAFSGTGGLIKSGAGTLFLTGASSFSGPLTAASGTLGGFYGSSGGGTLTNQATLSPGINSIGTFTNAGNVVLSASGTLIVDLGGSSNDVLAAGGTVTLAGTLSIVTNNVPLSAPSYDIVAAGGTLSGVFSATNGLPLDTSLVYDYAGKRVRLLYTPPSPLIGVTGTNGVAVVNGSGSPTIALGTDFGHGETGISVTNTFVITNSGLATLNLTNIPPVTISGDASFMVDAQPGSTSIPVGGSVSFAISFTTPAADNSRTGLVTIVNDGLLNNPFTFAVRGGPWNGIWISDSSGNWSDSSKWLDGDVAQSATYTAAFITDLTAARTVTNDLAGRTIGNLFFADTSPDNDWMLSGNPLKLDNLGRGSMITVSNRTATVSCVVTGAERIVKSGAGTLLLNAANVYTGGTTVSNGVLRMGSASSIPASSALTVDGGTFDINGNTLTLGSLAGLGGVVTNSGGLTVNQSGTTVYAGNVLLTGTLTKSGAGTLSLNGTTTIGGNLTINGGGWLTAGGGGSFSVGGGAANTLYIGVGGVSGNVDASAAGSFTANVGGIRVGYGPGDNNTGELRLGITNSINASTSILIGTTGTNERGTVTTANNGTTTIRTPYMLLGGAGTLDWGTVTLGVNAMLALEGTNGGRAQLILGQCTGAGSSGAWGAWGTADLSGGTASLKLSSLAVGQMTSTGIGNGAYIGQGTLTISTNAANHLDISGPGSVVSIGWAAGGNQNAAGTVTLGNLDATSLIVSTNNGTAILLGYKGGSGTAAGTFSLNGGTLTITTTGSAIAGGGGTGTLSLQNCTLIAGAPSTNWISGLTTAMLTSNVTFDTAANDIFIPQAFSGPGSLVKTNAGTLVLSGANTYSGATVIGGGTLVVGETGLLGGGTYTSSVAIASGTALRYDSAANQVLSGPVSGNGALVKTNTSILTLSGASTFSGGIALDAGTILLGSGAGSTTGLGAGAVTVRGGTYIGGAVPGSTVTVANNNTFALNGSFTAGDINFGTGAFTIASALAITAGNAVVIGGPVSGPGGINALDITFTEYPGRAFAPELQAPITLRSSQTVTVDASPGLMATISGAVGDGGNFYGVNKAGTGTLRLSGANTYSGNTTVSAGTLLIGNNLALQNSALNTAPGIASLSVSTPTLGGLIGSTDLASVFTSGYGSMNALTLNPGAGRTNEYSGIITSAGSAMSLTMAGAGVQVLSAAGDQLRLATVNGGTLVFATGSSNPRMSLTVNAGSACIIVTGAGAVSDTGVVSLNHSESSYGVLYLTNGVTEYVAGLYFDGVTQASGTWGATGSGAANTNDDFFAGTGVLVVSNSIGVDGSWNVDNSGNWNTAGNWLNGVIPGGVEASAYFVYPITADRTVVNDVASLALSNLVFGAPAHDWFVTGDTISLNGTITVITNRARIDSILAGSGSLTKAGTGTLTLAGTNTYEGGTIVNGGVLEIVGLGAGSGPVTINAGGTLAGTGPVSGVVTNKSGGTLAAGTNGVGAFTVGSLTLEPGCTNVFEFGAATNDLLVITNTGGLTVNGGGIRLCTAGTNTRYSVWGTYNLVRYTGPIVGDVTNLVVLDPNPAIAYTISTNGTYITVNFAPAGGMHDWMGGYGGGNNWDVPEDWVSGTIPGDYAAVWFGTNGSSGTVDLNSTSPVLSRVTFRPTVNTTIRDLGGTPGHLVLDNGGGGVDLVVQNGSHTISAGVDLLDNVGMTINNALHISGTISSSAGPRSLAVAGGTLRLSGSNTFSGGMTVSGGRLDINNNWAIGTNTLTINSGSTVANYYGGPGPTLPNNPIIWNGDFTVPDIISSVNFGNGPVTLTTNINIYLARLVVGGPITGPGGLNVFDITTTYPGGTGFQLDLYGAITLRSNQTVRLSFGTIYGTIGDGGNNYGLNLNRIFGSQSVALAGANTYGGDTTVTAGSLGIANNLALQNSPLVPSAGSFYLSVTRPVFGGLKGSVDLSSAFSSGYSSLASLTLNPGEGRTHWYYGSISNTAGMTLIKTGAGTQVLAGTNRYAGATTVSGGILDFAPGSSNATTYLAVNPGGTCVVETAAGVISDSGVLSMYHSGSDYGVFYLTNGVSETVGLLYFDGEEQVPGTWGATGSGAAHTNDSFFAGAGMLVVSGMVVPAGSWNVDSSGNWDVPANWLYNMRPVGAASSAYFTNSITADRMVTNTYSTLAISNLVFGSPANNWVLTGNKVEMYGGIAVNGGQATISSVLAGTGTVMKTGGGTLSLAGSNALSGVLSLNAGTLALGSGWSLGSGTLAISNGTTVSGSTIAGHNPLILNGDFSTYLNLGDGPVTLNRAGLTITGGFTIGGVVTGPGGLNAFDIKYTVPNGSGAAAAFLAPVTLRSNQTVTVNGWGPMWSGLTFSGAIGDDGKGYGLTVNSASSAARVILTGTNTYSGDTTVNSGVASVAGDLSVGIGNNLALQNSAFVLNAEKIGWFSSGVTMPVFGGLKGSIDTALAFANNPRAWNDPANYDKITALTLNPVAGRTNDYSGAIANGAPGMTLAKTGAGTQILSGISAYSGATTVSSGLLLVNGRIASPVTVASGGMIGGTGTINGNVTMQAGGMALLAPGHLLTITGSITLNDNVIHLNLPADLDTGSYTLATFNPTGSSGKCAVNPVIDSGSLDGTVRIATGVDRISLIVVRRGSVLIVR